MAVQTALQIGKGSHGSASGQISVIDSGSELYQHRDLWFVATPQHCHQRGFAATISSVDVSTCLH